MRRLKSLKFWKSKLMKLLATSRQKIKVKKGHKLKEENSERKNEVEENTAEKMKKECKYKKHSESDEVSEIKIEVNGDVEIKIKKRRNKT